MSWARVLRVAVALLVLPAACSKKAPGGASVAASATRQAGQVLADDIPVAHTPPGGLAAFPPLVLGRCTEPLAKGAPDLRGMWQAVSITVRGAPAPKDHPLYGKSQRIEQCGNRIVISGQYVVHDMRADGTAEHGVNDIAAHDLKTPIHGIVTFENGVHTIRPAGILASAIPGMVVTRRLEGSELVFTYMKEFTARSKRIGGPEVAPTPPSAASALPKH